MVLVCSRCSRVNPTAARYCHFDGLALSGNEDGAPQEAGSIQFLSPFVFPSGHTCHNFNELILAVEDHWDETEELLQKGFLGNFFAGMGRADLARLAGMARTATDPHRALDGLLARLPSSTRQPPKLHVQPTEINLGRISRGEDRRFVLRLVNEGVGLIDGQIVSAESPWLMIGEPPGVPDKVFEFRRELLLTIQVIGERLRVSPKPLQGKLLITTGSSTVTVLVQVECPCKPFPEGALMGAASPRELAEKAKAAPKEAAILFEGGAVRQWYESNSWDYPIQGPAAAGVGAVQQFFEALGLTTPPRVDISELLVRLQGRPGAALEHTLRISTQENRPVFAHARSEVPWLTIENSSGAGKTAKIKLRVPSVPPQPGESLLGRVQVEANGGQRFIVAVMLKIEGVRPPASVEPQLLMLDPSEVVPLPLMLDPSEVVPLRTLVPALDLDNARSTPEPGGKRQASKLSKTLVAEVNEPAPLPALPVGGSKQSWRIVYLLLLGIVLMVLVIALLRHALWPRHEESPENPPPPVTLADPNPHLAIRIHDGPKQNKFDVMPRPTMRFGLVLPREVDPADAGRLKRLTFDEWGRSNNTCLRIDGMEVLFGEPQGAWVERYRPLGKEAGTNREIDGFEAVWRFDALEVTQRVEIVPGWQSRCLDTCLVQYTLANTNPDRNGPAIRVGARFLLDAFIGSLDGVPYLLPGRTQLCDTMGSYEAAAVVPDFVEALERGEMFEQGTVARLHLRLGRRLESPGRLVLGAWPSQELQRFGQPRALGNMTGWDVPVLPMRELQERVRALANEGKVSPEVAEAVKPDSALTLYWDDKLLAPGAKREVGFAYGLGEVSKDPGGKVVLSMGGRFVSGGEITVCARVQKPQPGDTLTLKVPEGFDMLPGSELIQSVPPVPPGSARLHAVVTWRVKTGAVGTHQLELRGSTGTLVMQKVIVYPAHKSGDPGIFD